MSGSLDLFETAEAEPVPHLGDGLHWPEVRGWLQTHAQTLLDDRSLLEEIGLRPHGRNVVEFGAAALTRLEAVVTRESDARKQIEAVARANFAAQTQTHVAALDLMESRSHSDLSRRLDAVAQGRFGLAGAALAPNVVVKLPLTWDGLRACRVFTDKGIKTNVTLCFSAAQALLAAKAGATFVSPFVGRLEDNGADGIGLLEEIRVLYDVHGFDTQILAASLRNVAHVAAAAVAGSDAATFGADTFKALVNHPLTDKGLDAFVADWAKTGQSIL